MTKRKDFYAGIPRLWQGNRVYHGIVCGKGIRPRNGRVSVTVYMVRENGKEVYRATSGTGIAQKAINLGQEVAERQGLYDNIRESTSKIP